MFRQDPDSTFYNTDPDPIKKAGSATLVVREVLKDSAHIGFLSRLIFNNPFQGGSQGGKGTERKKGKKRIKRNKRRWTEKKKQREDRIRQRKKIRWVRGIMKKRKMIYPARGVRRIFTRRGVVEILTCHSRLPLRE